MEFSRPRVLEWVAIPLSRGRSQFQGETPSPALQADSLPSEPPGEAQSTHSICIVDPVHDASCLTVHTIHTIH